MLIRIDVLLHVLVRPEPQNGDGLRAVKTAERTVRGERRYYYATTPPVRALLITRGFPLEEVLSGWCYDASIGFDRGDSESVLDGRTGRRHTKITLRQLMPGVRADARSLSTVLAGAQRDEDTPIFQLSGSDALSEVLMAAESRYRALLALVGNGEPGPSPLALSLAFLYRTTRQPLRDELLARQVREHIERVRDALLLPMLPEVEVVLPAAFWDGALGQLLGRCQQWLGDESLTLSHVAQELYGASDAGALQRLTRLLEARRVPWWRDPDEPNPQRARRVSRTDVELLRQWLAVQEKAEA